MNVSIPHRINQNITHSLRLSVKQQFQMQVLQMSQMELAAAVQDFLNTDAGLVCEGNDTTGADDLSNLTVEATAAPEVPSLGDADGDDPKLDQKSNEEVLTLAEPLDAALWKEQSTIRVNSENETRPDPATEESFQALLLAQAGCLDLSAAIHDALKQLITALDANGFLPEESLDLLAHLPAVELEEARAILVELEPEGCGLAGPADYLRFQAERHAVSDEFRKAIVKYADRIVLGEVAEAARRAGVERKALEQTLQKLGGYCPSPGSGGSGVAAVRSIVPCAAIFLRDGEVVVVLREDGLLPRLTIRQDYLELAGRKDLDPEARTFLDQVVLPGIEKASEFRYAISKKHETVRRLLKELFARQKDFLVRGITGLRPLEQRELEEAIDRDESTISRTINGEYVLTPFGVLPLKAFFPRRAGDKSNADCVPVVVVRMRAIYEEAPGAQVTDDEMAARLQSEGFRISSRTVCKYRLNHLNEKRQRRRVSARNRSAAAHGEERQVHVG